MRRRPDTDNSGGVLSFTFLDVLMCTMGSMVLLLAVFSGGPLRPLADALARPGSGLATFDAKPAAIDDGSDDQAVAPENASPEELAAELAELRRREAELQALRARALESVADEQDRVAHLEDHERRLEHSLAKLHVTLKMLEEAEQKQSIDKEQAQREAERLAELVRDAENQLDALRNSATGKRSYAIVPYKGPNGTSRRPIYVECTGEAIIIQPEGIRLTADDFAGPLTSGNPLAAAIRAAQQDLNGRTPAGPGAEPPNPYPLFIVRPDGVKAYEVAVSSTRTWESDYGYEFVDADWNLTYPEPDPQLAQQMAHAVEQARSRQQLLAEAAPRRYARRLIGSASGGGPGGDSGSNYRGGGSGAGGASTFAEDVAASEAHSHGGGRTNEFATDGRGESMVQGGPAFASHGGPGDGAPSPDATMASPGAAADEFNPSAGNRYANAAGPQANPSSSAGSSMPSAAPGNQTSSSTTAATENAFATAGNGYSSAAANALQSEQQASYTPHGGAQAGASSASSGAAGAHSQSNNSFDAHVASAATTRGENWANSAASRRASPITRPIQVVVRPTQLAVLPVDAADPGAAGSAIVTLQQNPERVLDQLAEAIRSHISQWGLAGSGMYWRPMLILRVAPGAEPHARRLAALMEHSGVDVRLPEATASKEADHATR